MGKNRKKPRLKRAYLKRYSNGYIKGTSGVDSSMLKDLGYQQRAYSAPDLAELMGLVTHSPQTLQLVHNLEATMPGILDKHVCLENTKRRKLFMYYGIKGGACMFVEVYGVAGIIQRSVSYPSRDVAMARYQARRITWVEVQQASPPATELAISTL